MLLKDYMNKEVNKTLRFTFKTYKKSSGRYIATSVNKMSITAPRLKNFLSHNGLTHRVVFDVLDEGVLEIYIKAI